ncbi:MAG TPA: hypothetical protein P5510_10080, partial [Clostridia bacterium]|nr:hypothetical protein [Clostridia bacterium]
LLSNPTSKPGMNSHRMPALKAEEEYMYNGVCSNRVVPRVKLRPFHVAKFFYCIVHFNFR